MGKHKRKTARFALNESHFNLVDIHPMTSNQTRVFEDFENGKHLFLHGVAGTGKTYISLYLAARELFDLGPRYKNLSIVRSVVPTRDIGFLPGSEEQKMEVYEAPYKSIFSDLFCRGDAYPLLKKKGAINFMTTSFIRGVTLNDTIVLVDECQNMNFHELDSIITRLGKNCRIIFCGDFRQSDFTKTNDKDGILKFMEIMKNMPDIGFTEFIEHDIVRSCFVKSYILNKLQAGIV